MSLGNEDEDIIYPPAEQHGPFSIATDAPSHSEGSEESKGGWKSTFTRWLQGNDEEGEATEAKPSRPSEDAGIQGVVSTARSFESVTAAPIAIPSPRGLGEDASDKPHQQDVVCSPLPMSQGSLTQVLAAENGPSTSDANQSHDRASSNGSERGLGSRASTSSTSLGATLQRRASSIFRGRPKRTLSADTSSPSQADSTPSSVGSSSGPGTSLNLKNIVTQGAASIKAHLDASQTYRSMREDSTEREQRRRSVEAGSPGTLAQSSSRMSPSTPTKRMGSDATVAEDGTTAPSGSFGAESANEHVGSSILDLPQQVPKELQLGEPMLKVTSKKVKQRTFRLDADRGQILWDSKKNNKVDLESICEVRWASAAAAYRTSLSISASHEPRWLSIIYQRAGEYKALHLIALSDESLARWKKGLEVMQNARRALLGLDNLSSGPSGTFSKETLWLKAQWKDADTNTQDEKLDLGEIIKLCKRLGIQSSAAQITEKFARADERKKGYLDFPAFQQFVKLLKRRPEIEQIFKIWCDDGTLTPTGEQIISKERFLEFLKAEQKVNLDEETYLRIFRHYAGSAATGLTLEGFTSYLCSVDNAPISESANRSVSLYVPDSPKKDRMAAETTEQLLETAARDRQQGRPSSGTASCQPQQDMQRPLCEYYISSSHNTYLVGNQWKGDSTVEGYIRALQKGARSVELDCWDGPNNQPQITHGRTLTGKVPFVDVIQAIGKYAFVTSPYPVILSLEVHNDLPQQDVLARILRETLGDKLLSERLKDWPHPDVLPSPEALKGKILVKAKNLFIVEAEKRRAEREGDDRAEAWVAPADVDPSASDETASDDGLTSQFRRRASFAKRLSGASIGSASSTGTSREEKGPKKVLMSTALASLLIYTIGVKSRGINKKEVYAPEHMISLSEKSAFKYVKTVPDDLIKHNRSHLTRIYPSMSSIARLHASANFLPHHLWAIGAQLVALNWQTADLGMELNQAMFARNGRTGYVLKPDGLRAKDLVKTSSGERFRVLIELEIVSAQQLPRAGSSGGGGSGGKDKDGKEEENDILSPSVSVTLLTPQSWGSQPEARVVVPSKSLSTTATTASGSSAVSTVGAGNNPLMTNVVRRNGFNPIFKRKFLIPVELPYSASSSSAAFAAVANGTGTADATSSKDVRALTRGLLDLCFLRFQVNSHDLAGGGADDAADDSDNGATAEGNTASSSSASMSSSSSASPRSSASSLAPSNEGLSGSASSIAPPSPSKPSDADSTNSNSIASTLKQYGEGTPIARYTVCVGSLQEGYRHVPLYDCHLTPCVYSSLFVRSRVKLVGVLSSSPSSSSEKTTFKSSTGNGTRARRPSSSAGEVRAIGSNGATQRTGNVFLSP